MAIDIHPLTTFEQLKEHAAEQNVYLAYCDRWRAAYAKAEETKLLVEEQRGVHPAVAPQALAMHVACLPHGRSAQVLTEVGILTVEILGVLLALVGIYAFGWCFANGLIAVLDGVMWLIGAR
jgi:hypothetical protein